MKIMSLIKCYCSMTYLGITIEGATVFDSWSSSSLALVELNPK